MSSFVHVNQENFDQVVLKAGAPVLVEFGATWCAPCKRLEPELEKLAAEQGGKVTLAKLDVDESADLTMRYQVMSVPTTILFVNGQAMERLTGYQPKDRVLEKIEPHL
jgi:thioredoxin 1